MDQFSPSAPPDGLPMFTNRLRRSSSSLTTSPLYSTSTGSTAMPFVMDDNSADASAQSLRRPAGVPLAQLPPMLQPDYRQRGPTDLAGTTSVGSLRRRSSLSSLYPQPTETDSDMMITGLPPRERSLRFDHPPSTISSGAWPPHSDASVPRQLADPFANNPYLAHRQSVQLDEDLCIVCGSDNGPWRRGPLGVAIGMRLCNSCGHIKGSATEAVSYDDAIELLNELRLARLARVKRRHDVSEVADLVARLQELPARTYHLVRAKFSARAPNAPPHMARRPSVRGPILRPSERDPFLQPSLAVAESSLGGISQNSTSGQRGPLDGTSPGEISRQSQPLLTRRGGDAFELPPLRSSWRVPELRLPDTAPPLNRAASHYPDAATYALPRRTGLIRLPPMHTLPTRSGSSSSGTPLGQASLQPPLTSSDPHVYALQTYRQQLSRLEEAVLSAPLPFASAPSLNQASLLSRPSGLATRLGPSLMSRASASHSTSRLSDLPAPFPQDSRRSVKDDPFGPPPF